MTMLAAIAVAGYLLCLPAHGFAQMVGPWLLIAVAVTALVPLADATTLAAAARGELDYGRVRLWGTIAFIAATVVGGRILTGRSSEAILYLLIGMMAVTAICCALVPRVTVAPRAGARRGARRGARWWRDSISSSSPRRPWCRRATPSITPSARFIGRARYPDATIAWLWAEGAIAEVALFYFGARHGAAVGRGGAVGAGRRRPASCAGRSPPSSPRCRRYGADPAAARAHLRRRALGAMRYLADAMPPARAGTAQTFYNACVNGLGLGLASLAAGGL